MTGVMMAALLPDSRWLAASRVDCFQRGLLVPVFRELARLLGSRGEHRALLLHELTPLRLLRRDALFAAMLHDGKTRPWRGAPSDLEGDLSGRLLLVEPTRSPLRAFPRAGAFLVAPIYRVERGGALFVRPRVAYLDLPRRRFRAVDERYGGERKKPIESVTADEVIDHFIASFGMFRLSWWSGNGARRVCEQRHDSGDARTDQDPGVKSSPETMYNPQRRYPRIPFERDGEVRPDGAGAPLAVTVRCLSCEGAGIDLPEGAELRPSATVTLRLELPEGTVELPARVVWAAGGHAGLKLRLSEVDAESKKTFGAWIVPRTKEALAGARSE